jgi:antitoxin YefM
LMYRCSSWRSQRLSVPYTLYTCPSPASRYASRSVASVRFRARPSCPERALRVDLEQALDEGRHRCPLMTSGHSPVRSTVWRFLVILLTMTTMPLADVKARLSELVGRVQAHHERVTVTVHGRPSAVLIAVEDLEALQETLSVLSDPDTLRRLVESDAELARGKVVGAEELAESMAARRRHSA